MFSFSVIVCEIFDKTNAKKLALDKSDVMDKISHYLTYLDGFVRLKFLEAGDLRIQSPFQKYIMEWVLFFY